MSKKVYGGYDVYGNATTENRRLAQSIDGEVFDQEGNLDIDSYTKQELEDIVGVLPLSHYGTHTYLPAGVSGSFEGASDVNTFRFRAVCLEDDGQLTVLRCGTNGATRGVYYAYVPNALHTTNLNTNQNTNRKYAPGYMTAAGNQALTLYPSDNGVVSGLCVDSSNTQSIFISWRNGTLDDTQHTGSIVSIGLIETGVVNFVMTGNTDIFFFIGFYSNNQYLYKLKSIPIAKIKAGATISGSDVTHYTNWTTSEFNSKVNVNNDILLLSNVSSTNASDKPYALIVPEAVSYQVYMGDMDLYCAQDPSGKIRMRCVGDMWITSQYIGNRPKHSFSFMLDLSAKTAKLENNDTPITSTYNTTTHLVEVSGSTISVDPIYTWNGNRGNLQITYFYTNTGSTFAYATVNLNSSLPLLARAIYPNVTTIFEQLEVRKVFSTDWIEGLMYTSFGSPVGGEVVGFEWLPNQNYTVISTNGKSVAQQSYNEYVQYPLGDFKSVSRGTVTGFKPTTNRFVSTIPFENRKILVNTVGTDNVQTSGGIFIDKWRLTQAKFIDPDFNQSGRMTVKAEELESIKANQLAACSFDVDYTNDNRIVVYVPKQTDLPAFALITGVTKKYRMFYRLVQLTASSRVNDISLTFLRFVKEEEIGNNDIRANQAQVGVGNTSIGIDIYDMGTHYFVGGAQPLYWGTVGNSVSYTFRASVEKTTGTMDFTIGSLRSNNSDASGNQPMACPMHGFGVCDFSLGYLDDRVRIYFTSYGKTYADYQAWTAKEDPILIAGQDVAQGFIVYFTEETPVLLSGKSFTMPITNIDLTTIKSNPANTTFYVYVKMVQGLAKYVITEIPLPETGTTSYTTFWIGTITTGNENITSINIDKRSRLDIFGSSLEARGSSFPISYGLPTDTGTINW